MTVSAMCISACAPRHVGAPKFGIPNLTICWLPTTNTWLRGWRIHLKTSSRLFGSKNNYHRLHVAGICVNNRGLRFHQIWDFKQYYFNGNDFANSSMLRVQPCRSLDVYTMTFRYDTNRCRWTDRYIDYLRWRVKLPRSSGEIPESLDLGFIIVWTLAARNGLAVSCTRRGGYSWLRYCCLELHDWKLFLPNFNKRASSTSSSSEVFADFAPVVSTHMMIK